MAARSITTKIALEGSDEIRKQLETLGKSGEDAFAKIKQSGANLNFDQTGAAAQRLGQNLAQAGQSGQQAGQQITQAFTGVSQQIEAANASSSGLSVGFGTAAAGIVAALAVIGAAVSSALTAMTAAAADANDKLQAAADKAGLTASAYEDMANRIETAGGNVDKTVSALQRLAAAAQTGAEQLAAAGEKAGQGGKGFLAIGENAGGAAPQVKLLGDSLVQTFNVMKGDGSGEQARVEIIKVADAATKAANQVGGLGGVLQKLGIDLKSFATADAATQLEELRAAFEKIKDPLEKNRIAANLFGADWRSMLQTLSQTKQAAAEADEALLASGRKLSDEARQNLKDYTAATGELQAALKATKEQIAAIFAPGATQRAKWLTELIDAGREWLKTLAEIKAKQLDTFFADRGGKSFIVEILERARSLASDFAAVITSLVLPAIRLLQAGFEAAAAKINELFGTEISGQFLGIAAAIGVVTGAFGLIGAVLSPIGALFLGLVALALRFKTALLDAALGGKAFWEDLVAVASRALAAIRAELPAVMEALRALFKGDFASAWEQFAALGARAFEAIKSAIAGIEGPLGSFFATLRTGFNFIMGVLAVFAATLNAVFGTQLSADALAFYLVLLQLGGVFSTLLPAVAAMLAIFGRIGGVWVAIGAAAVILYRKMDDLRGVAELIKKAFSDMLGGDLAGALNNISAAFSKLWDSIKQESAGTWVILGVGATLFAGRLVALFGPLATTLFAPLAAAGVAIWPALVAAATTAAAGVTTAFSALAATLFAPIAAAGVAVWPPIVAAARAAAASIALLFTPGGLIAAALVGLAALMVAFWPQISAAAGPAFAAVSQFAADAWQAIVQTATAAWQSVVDFVSQTGASIFDGLSQSGASIWQAITQAATTAWQTIQQMGTSVWTSIQSAATSAWQSVQATANSVWQSIVESISGAGESLFTPIMEAAGNAFNAILEAGGKVAEGLKSFFEDVGQFISAAMDRVKGIVDSVLSAVMGAINTVLSLLARLGSGIGGGKGNPTGDGSENGAGGHDSNGLPDFSGGPGFSRGGQVFGAGTGTSDSIPAWLSNGEFVIRSEIVKKLGPAFFAALNGGRFSALRKAFPGFALGGLVNAFAMPSVSLQIPRYAAGGLVNQRAGTVSFPLDIGGQQYDLQGHPDTVAALQRHSTLRQISATNKRAPGWNR